MAEAGFKFTKISKGIVEVFEKMGITISPSQTLTQREVALFTLPLLQEIAMFLILIYCKTVNKDKNLTFFMKEESFGSFVKLELTQENKGSLVITEDEVLQMINYFEEKLPVMEKKKKEDASTVIHLTIITFHLAHTLYKRKMV